MLMSKLLRRILLIHGFKLKPTNNDMGLFFNFVAYNMSQSLVSFFVPTGMLHCAKLICCSDSLFFKEVDILKLLGLFSILT